MRFNPVKTIFLKEMRETLRDKKVVFMMILLPTFLYPFLFLIISQVQMIQKAKIESTKVEVILSSNAYHTELKTLLEKEKNLSISEGEVSSEIINNLQNTVGILLENNFESAIDSNKSAEFRLFYDGTKEIHSQAKTKINKIFDSFNSSKLNERLERLNFDTTFTKPIFVAYENIASEKDKLGDLLGKFIPAMIVYFLLLGSIYPAIDLTAGEKERKTLQTIYTAPVEISEIITGKFFTVFLISLVSSFANLLSLVFTLYFQILLGAKSGLGLDFNFSFSIGNAFWSVLLLALTATLISAITMTVTLLAKSYKEAQSFITPLIIAFIIPLTIVNLPGMELSLTNAFIPVLNVLLAMVAIFKNSYDLQHLFFVAVTTLGYSGLAIFAAVRIFSNESVVTGEKINYKILLKSQKSGEKVFGINEALLFYFVLLLVYFYVGSTLQTMLDIKIGLPLSLAGILGGFSLATIFVFKLKIKETLQLNKVRFLGLFGTVLVSFTAMFLLDFLVGKMVEFPDSYLEKFAQSFSAIESLPLYLQILILGVTPGIFEEIAFRGVLFKGLQSSFGKWQVILISAIAFGIMHFDVYRLIPTTLLGILLGWIVWETKTIFLSILCHALHNSLITVFNSLNHDFLTALDENKTLTLVVASIVFLVGLFLIKISSKSINSTT
ncbi:CPBP family intramembrane metalloprotease [bacterium]|nr:CPBP family intramembrane metalloprotease [bacterium]